MSADYKVFKEMALDSGLTDRLEIRDFIQTSMKDLADRLAAEDKLDREERIELAKIDSIEKIETEKRDSQEKKQFQIERERIESLDKLER